MTATGPAHRPDRLRRAWELVTSGRVERIGPRQYKVAGNVEPFYYVDLSAEIPCMCRDEENRGEKIHHQCKHRLAARLAAKETALLLSLIELMEFKDEDES